MSFVVYFCHDCQTTLCDAGIAGDHVTRRAHVVEKMWLHRRERKSLRGVQVQWSTDWEDSEVPSAFPS